jgi:hypothetical protein
MYAVADEHLGVLLPQALNHNFPLISYTLQTE